MIKIQGYRQKPSGEGEKKEKKKRGVFVMWKYPMV